MANQPASLQQVGAFITSLFTLFWGLVIDKNKKLADIESGKIQKLIDQQDKRSLIDEIIKFINNGGQMQMVGNHEVNTNNMPALPFAGATVEFHEKRGVVAIQPSKVTLHLSPNQKDGKVIKGHNLRKELKGMPVMDACELDYYLANPHLIPEEWKGKVVFFWGTIFRNSGVGLFVRCLIWFDDAWQSCYRWLGDDFDGNVSEALSAN